LLKDSMHEASIMQTVFDLALARLQQEAATRIVRLRLRVGVVAGVVPEALAFAFEAMKADTPAAGAELDIERVPARLACHYCQREFETETFPAPCPGCGNWAAEVRHGRELDLVLVEFVRED
jgi:hydrogenase nickel incorporation protein HypA/HybF